MPVQLGSQGQPGFDEPFALMMDCHRRIEHFLGVFERVVERSAGQTIDEDAAAALRTALHYFKAAAPKHTADEEDSLLPELRELNRRDLAPLLKQAEVLEAQHRQAEQLHDRLHRQLTHWLQAGTLDPPALDELHNDLAALRVLYREHIAFEDSTLFPAAQRALDQAAVQRIGSEMAARRGIDTTPSLAPDHPPSAIDRDHAS